MPVYKITINIKRTWAYFTVDGEPTRHQTPETVKLTAGPHMVHFWNDLVHATKEVTIDVPAHDDATWAGSLSD
jgi:hypothetical protein